MKLKICGMNDQENTISISELQPDFLGFIFWNDSKRYCKNVIENIPNDIEKVGVFVDANYNEIVDKIISHKLNFVQLHGEESPDFCLEMKKTNIKVIKAITIDNNFNFNELKYNINCVDYFLFDTKGDLPGGNGTTFDWEILNQYKEDVPYFLSGGIGLDECPKLEKFLKSEVAKNCYAIDINSQFEDEPGIKNKQKIKEFQEKLNQMR
ncbi:phosphoribosylanthranilate isomerase [Flavobacterium azooxidireducens]|uniref:N-(5'-phosphoribosyl)anthranilate isomerase n=1 Tax=Flavobacterium azooxidireducens TaxID=1871076 RepID=A0ABY4KDZ4_9FLAO|nr:phosphoribosylanthranilate isomerase [Flavobacterium azooxidireducens]UPQ79038.1 phosphoribosylanthranilate isomerase [Flavobacterium azooxidireducens]